MKRQLFLVCLLCIVLKVQGQDVLFKSDLVDLKGRISYTVIRNSTSDTLKIRARSFYYLPYYETEVKVDIPPKETDTLKFSLAYPDFIQISSLNVNIWNAPGKVVECDVKGVDSGKWDVDFHGELAQQNNYYRSYQTSFNGFAQETSAYYKVGDAVKDFNLFPAMADSITKACLSFLNNYQGPLPDWFKKHEANRLKYNGGFRKYNVLLAKEFKDGKEIPVDSGYYSFEKDLPLKASGMVLNTEFLWYASFRLGDKRGENRSLSRRFEELDKLLEPSLVNDVIKMRLMSNVFKNSRKEYEGIMNSLKFYDPHNKAAVDSITTLKNRYPVVGGITPDFILTDINNTKVPLSQFSGKPVILNFWASWCVPCLKELPSENDLYKQYSDRGLVIINVCIETDKEKWKVISRQQDLRMVNLYASPEEYKKIRSAYNIEELPRSVLIGRDMRVEDNYFKKASQISKEEIESILKD